MSDELHLGEKISLFLEENPNVSIHFYSASPWHGVMIEMSTDKRVLTRGIETRRIEKAKPDILWEMLLEMAHKLTS